ncbi:sensor histidine kinase [Virgibacillus halodenitrificans]|uniref:sensor histidine kinase n=1 Tax=Virgibacillus halodenitrificans TaxID=1482 RepID=UPI002DBC0875|nr:HAMP domain-containing sensor histidine kinase [Virgibacillus halodenitrificans]MEC2158343.1 HAMP domain-containing sensor histidine kinase [Virgibacillus halodenitrificans]
MTFVAILLVFLLILFIYKSINTISAIFLYGIFISAVFTYAALILYLSKFNLYYVTLNQLFNFNPGTWSNLVLQNFNTDALIRFLNGGSILFYLFYILFSLSFCITKWFEIKQIRYILYTILFLSLSQFLFFDPGFNIYMQNVAYTHNNMEMYKIISGYGSILFHWVNYIYLFLGFILLIWHFFKNYQIRFLRNHTLFTLFSLLPLTFIYLLMFYFAPTNLVKSTFISNFNNYQLPELTIIELRLFPLVVTLALLFMFYNAYKYNLIKKSNKEFNLLTHTNIDTASLGVRTFTHSIKNHLLAIRSEAEFLKEKKFNNDEDALYSLELILESCRQSSESLESALDRLTGFRISPTFSALNQPVELAIKRFNPQHTSIQIVSDLSEKQLFAYIDQEMLQETIYNIIKNAEEAINNEDGKIHITTSKINKWGMVTIEDNGPGISNENKKRLFTPFFSTKSSITNWGIGLSYCYKVIKLHGGTIEFSSNKEKGTRFNILIPLAEQKHMRNR